jgi:hypothetical protein
MCTPAQLVFDLLNLQISRPVNKDTIESSLPVPKRAEVMSSDVFEQERSYWGPKDAMIPSNLPTPKKSRSGGRYYQTTFEIFPERPVCPPYPFPRGSCNDKLLAERKSKASIAVASPASSHSHLQPANLGERSHDFQCNPSQIFHQQ